MSTATTHLWLVDSRGKVFTACRVEETLDAIRSGETLSDSQTSLDISWQSVDGLLDKIACGYGGLVCGTRDKILYVRRGVSFRNPLGSSWARCLCDVVDMAVGKESVVRQTSSGEFFTCRVDTNLLSPPVLLPSWKLVPQCTLWGKAAEQNGIQHFVLDSRDNLYVLSSSGGVYIYQDLGTVSEDETRWTEVSKPPNSASNTGVSLFSFLLGWGSASGGETAFSFFCAGGHTSDSNQVLWCVRTEEAWQLVVSEFVGSDGKKQLKTNWNKVNLPKRDKIAAVCSDKTTSDILFAIVDEGKALCAIDLRSEGKQVVLPAPQGNLKSQRWKSIGVCQTVHTPSSSSNPPQVSSLYPKLPALSEPHTSWTAAEEGEELGLPAPHAHKRKWSDPTAGRGEMLKRARLVSYEAPSGLGGSSLKRRLSLESHDEGDEEFYTSLSQPVRRPRIAEHPQMVRYFLLDGVGFNLREFKPTRLYKYTRPYQINVPISPEAVDEQFSYSFDLERDVLRETGGKEVGTRDLSRPEQ